MKRDSRRKGPGKRRRPSQGEDAAFVTLLMLNDSYLPGALMLAHALDKQALTADLVCLISEEVTRPARLALGRLFDQVIEVDKLHVPHSRAQKRQYLPYVFTKLNALRLGADGDLGFAYDKVILLDADLLPLRRFGDLPALPAPAGILNEHKTHLMQWDQDGEFTIPQSVQETGRWHWHLLYDPICPHGHPIPPEITDRVKSDPTNMGINGSLLVMAPSMAEFGDILGDIERPEIRQYLSDAFDWPEMQYLTMRWSGRWTNIDARYSGLNGYPGLNLLYGTHYAGFKPWYFGRGKSMTRYGRYPDFRHWFREFAQMVTIAHPQLRESRQLMKLLQSIEAFSSKPA
jgi:glycogenin glucosyltransferase